MQIILQKTLEAFAELGGSAAFGIAEEAVEMAEVLATMDGFDKLCNFLLSITKVRGRYIAYQNERIVYHDYQKSITKNQ